MNNTVENDFFDFPR